MVAEADHARVSVLVAARGLRFRRAARFLPATGFVLPAGLLLSLRTGLLGLLTGLQGLLTGFLGLLTGF